MSALTDLFTAMANKIRSKTGTATTYTPLEMVSDGIDDVYAAGYDAGGGGASGIPITPSNASPVSLTTGESYSALADGYAIESCSLVTPSNSAPSTLNSGSIYKMGGAGKAVASVTNMTPSNTTPESLSRDNIYKPSANGYAIASYQTITPTSSGTDISGGEIVKFSANGTILGSVQTVIPAADGTSFSGGYKYMSGGGYAYSVKPASGYTYGWDSSTTLWTNSSPTSSFNTQTITLSQSIDNFSYIKIRFRMWTDNATESEIIVTPTDLKKSLESGSTTLCAIGVHTSSGSYIYRRIIYTSTTQLKIDVGRQTGSSVTNQNGVIPLNVYGLK